MKTIATIALAALLAGSGAYALAQQTPAPDAPAASQDQGRPQAPSPSEPPRTIRTSWTRSSMPASPDQGRPQALRRSGALWLPRSRPPAPRPSGRALLALRAASARDQRRSMDFMQRLERAGR